MTSANCDNLRPRLSAFHDEAHPEDLRRSIEAHLNTCDDCRSALRDVCRNHIHQGWRKAIIWLKA